MVILMGLFDRFKKDNSNEKNKINNENVESKEQIVNTSAKSNGSDFKYLDNIIHSGNDEIIIDKDIILDSDEELQYPEGINVNIDDIIIDGNGHSIDANSKTSIFKITSKNVIIKNIKFKNAHSDYGSVIYNDENTNTKILSSEFNGNYGKINGGAIINYGTILFEDSKFIKNQAHRHGGVFINHGELNIKKCLFKGNSCNQKDGGVIFNKSILNIDGCDFIENYSMQGCGGAISNIGKTVIKSSNFEDNDNKSHHGGTAIFNEDGSVLEISNSKIIAEDKYNPNMIQFSFRDEGDLVKINDCTFEEKSSGKISDSF